MTSGPSLSRADQPPPDPQADARRGDPVAGGLDPDAGWQVWEGELFEWPVTTLPAMEAVEAAKDQGLKASEALDRALRVAFFGASRSVSMHHVILDVVSSTDGVDAGTLGRALELGEARRRLFDHMHLATSSDVAGSPHLFLADGGDAHNPGIEMHWEGDHDSGFPVVSRDEPGIYEDLQRRAARDGR